MYRDITGWEPTEEDIALWKLGQRIERAQKASLKLDDLVMRLQTEYLKAEGRWSRERLRSPEQHKFKSYAEWLRAH